MFKILVAIFILVPIVELWGLITVGQWIGAWNTIGLVLLTGVLGAWLAKKEGLQTIQLVRLQLSRGEIPTHAMLDGLCILIGGIFLIFPGFFTDLIGFFLLLPYTRNIVKAWLVLKFTSWIRSGHFMIIKNRKN